MKLTLLAVGDKLPAWAEAACAEYVKRMPREARVEIVAVKAEKRTGLPAEQVKAAEASRLLDRCPKGALLVALDEHGRQVSTRELGEQLAGWMASGRDVALLIGGADGLAPEILAKAELRLALSRLTLPHALARVLLAEQLYRAASLLAGHPYHRD
ncbi:MAG: 23S rRNA (pseudouridine(1915)-N(3))-methyltransferase RlmH [Thiobacillaceae bacterium]|jgi:23S rRNA (pseudouridine1915-N3)-methyltransferase|nr:23S rRNA (pseudouridine(1915)-N(3))-methyltransferase RlmH [Thiobacillaceae bacterium]